MADNIPSLLDPILIEPEKGLIHLTTLLNRHQIDEEVQMMIVEIFAESIAEAAPLDDRPACVEQFVDDCVAKVFGQ